MPPTVSNAFTGPLTDDEQLYHDLLDNPDFDQVGRAWGHGNLLTPSVADQDLRPPDFALPLCASTTLPDFDILGLPPPPATLAAWLDPLPPRYDTVSDSMAATPFESNLPGDSLFNIYSDANSTVRGPPAPALPDGECNYLYVYPGANPVKCGCRRFWSRAPVAPTSLGEAIAPPDWAHCMCSHHACYHDHKTSNPEPVPQVQPQTPGNRVSADVNTRGKPTREVLSPLQDISFRFTQGLPSPLEFPNPADNTGAAGLSFGADRPGHNPPGFAPGSQTASPAPPDGSLPDTLCWADATRQSPNVQGTGLPPIPAQCLMPSPSRPSSVAESSQSRYLRPFAGRGMQTLSGVRNLNSRQPLQERLTAPVTDSRDVPTSHPDKHISPPNNNNKVINPSQDLGDTQPFSSYTTPHPREALRNLSDAVDGHEQRIDRLENVSFTAANHDECYDRYDQIDLRVTDLESRIEDCEKAARNRLEESTTGSVISEATASTATVTTIHKTFAHSHEVVQSQISSLRDLVGKIQGSLPPSFEAPWEVEVVFLPFPLKRVWQEVQDFKADAAGGIDLDEWTQMPTNTYSNTPSTMRAQSPFGGEWAGGHDFEWLLPRACSPKGIINERLRSRGLVRSISVKGPDARSVQVAINSVFGDIIRDMSRAASSSSSSFSSKRSRRRSLPSSLSARAGQFLGLTNEWVPLRKIHKDSRLRFLSPAEMLTPAMWDVQFLNSVMMKSSGPRLYVTQPAAYLQDLRAYEEGWTWQRLRELPRYYPEGSGACQTPGVEIPEADALEEYWAWNEQLDGAPGVVPGPPVPPGVAKTGSSLSRQLQQYQHQQQLQHLHQQRRLASSSPSQQYFTGVEVYGRSSTPSRSRGQTPVPVPVHVPVPPQARTARKRPAQLPYIRTGSVPAAVPPFFSPGQNRRVVSGGSGNGSGSAHERQVVTQARPASGAVVKRRATRSPSRPRFTPRWSTKSPSPMIGTSRLRSITPFNYATPYSNGPGMEPPAGSGYGEPRYSDGQRYYDGYDDEDDIDIDVDIYDDGEDCSAFEDDEYDDDDDRGGRVEMEFMHDRQVSPTGAQLPEDEPWPGIEDRMSDGENIDPLTYSGEHGEEGEGMDGDGDSQMSSQPSEYPSTQLWNGGEVGDGVGFRIHEDGDGGVP